MRIAEGVLRYGDSPWQRVDTYTTDGGAAGAPIVLVHGGFWRHDRTARDLEPMAVALARRGCRVAVVEYRPSWDGGAWPGLGYDARRALDALFTLGSGWARGWFVGHSAGAHVLLCALAGRGAGVATLLLAPVVDVELAAARGLGAGAATSLTAAHVRCGGATSDATPLLRPADVSTLEVLAAGDDQAVPADVVSTQVDAWIAAGVAVRCRSLPGARHMHLVNPDRSAGAGIIEMLAQPGRVLA